MDWALVASSSETVVVSKRKVNVNRIVMGFALFQLGWILRSESIFYKVNVARHGFFPKKE